MLIFFNLKLFLFLIFGFCVDIRLYRIRPVRRAERLPRIRRPTWTTRATVRRPPRPTSAVGADGAAGGRWMVGTRWTHHHRSRTYERGTRRPQGPRKTTGKVARAARNRPATTVRVQPVAAGAAPRRWTVASAVVVTAAGTLAEGWETSFQPRP